MPEELPTLSGDRIVLRPPLPADRSRFAEILAEPSVARWWGGSTTADDLFALDGEVGFTISVDGLVAGWIQYAEELEPDYHHASIDLFLDTAHQGRGFGPEAIRLVARYLFDARGHHRLTIDPAAANEQAIRAYERVGFRRVGIMRQYERAADGTWHDGLLMDLLNDELT